NMNRTRSLVWLYNARVAINNGRIGTQEQLVSFLVALPLILKTTPRALRQCFAPICEFFARALKDRPLNLREEEIRRLKGLLEEDPLTFALSSLVKHNSHYHYTEQARPTKFVVNPWFHLKLKERTMPDDELKNVLLNGAKYNGKFIIYGAGELGERWVRILLAADIKPAFVVDRAWRQLPAIEGIRVCSPDKISDANIDLVIIASKGSKKDIESFIKTRRSDIKIL
ncbi:hypothetical protein, partial [Alteromonas sp. 14N.309.X.WAT.G.H12]|uniref:hypothetical protein n=1 Tax=Alteromonas sp. 14N.309.X.WAT.G.H12 TaxID=3120824 RepID=UPI002FD1B8DF